ncbi:MAG: MHYT domain-containing protein [Micropepsaceae bacterium]
MKLVALAALVCLFACYTTAELLSRARDTAGRKQMGWVLTAGTVAGCGIWATHFVAMLAFKSALPISYDVALTALSILAAVVIAAAGFTVALKTRFRLLGGAITGAAVATMHFLGMEALRGPVTVQWEADYVAASLVAGITLSALALSAALKARTASATVGAAALMTFGICAMHFTAMTAVTLTPIAGEAETSNAVAPTSLAVAVAAVAMLVIGLGAVATMMKHHRDERAQGEELRGHVAALEAAKSDLETTSRELEAALRDAARGSEAKSRFLAGMSHELRTPLNAIIGYSEFMSLQPFGPIGNARYLEYVGDIRKSGGHLLALINDVLDLARLDAGHVELLDDTLDIGELIESSISLVAPQALKGGVTVEADAANAALSVRADERRLKQVLVNLLSNAVKFTPPEGRVRVSVRECDGGAIIAVSDDGIGMRPEDIPVALDRFGQVESAMARRYHGTGLGLPLARELIENHGGTLTIESVFGEGTTVTVTLPQDRVLPSGAGLVRAA